LLSKKYNLSYCSVSARLDLYQSQAFFKLQITQITTPTTQANLENQEESFHTLSEAFQSNALSILAQVFLNAS
jgi:alpha-D-ribose 1-methylphosphonate 5-triphosphate synthase subunit PhnH